MPRNTYEDLVGGLITPQEAVARISARIQRASQKEDALKAAPRTSEKRKREFKTTLNTGDLVPVPFPSFLVVDDKRLRLQDGSMGVYTFRDDNGREVKIATKIAEKVVHGVPELVKIVTEIRSHSRALTHVEGRVESTHQVVDSRNMATDHKLR